MINISIMSPNIKFDNKLWFPYRITKRFVAHGKELVILCAPHEGDSEQYSEELILQSPCVSYEEIWTPIQVEVTIEKDNSVMHFICQDKTLWRRFQVQLLSDDEKDLLLKKKYNFNNGTEIARRWAKDLIPQTKEGTYD